MERLVLSYRNASRLLSKRQSDSPPAASQFREYHWHKTPVKSIHLKKDFPPLFYVASFQRQFLVDNQSEATPRRRGAGGGSAAVALAKRQNGAAALRYRPSRSLAPTRVLRHGVRHGEAVALRSRSTSPRLVHGRTRTLRVYAFMSRSTNCENLRNAFATTWKTGEHK